MCYKFLEGSWIESTVFIPKMEDLSIACKGKWMKCYMYDTWQYTCRTFGFVIIKAKYFNIRIGGVIVFAYFGDWVF